MTASYKASKWRHRLVPKHPHITRESKVHDKLEVEDQDTINSPAAADVEKALAALDLKGPAYCILTKADGSYVQTAGTKVGLIVEYRKLDGAAFQHYVIGHHSHDSAPTSVRYRHGSLQLRRNEVLLVNEAREIFVWYLATGLIADGWQLRDITDTFE
jgi:hypothetical protein